MKKKKNRKILAILLSLCLIMAFYPLQASAEDDVTKTIKTQADWDTLAGQWPATVTIDAAGGTITASGYIGSNIKVVSGTFSYTGTDGHPLSSVTVSDGTFNNGGVVTDATVTGGTFTNSAGGRVRGLILSGSGSFTNSGTIDGSITVSGGTFTNEAGGTVSWPFTMSGGNFSNSGSVQDVTLNGGTFTMNAGSSNPADVTMTGGTLANSTGSEVKLKVNGQDYSIPVKDKVTGNDILSEPTGLKWQKDDTHKKAVAEWNSSDDVTINILSLYKHGTNSPVFTDTTGTGTYDFTDKIIENGYGEYDFTVQAKADGKISSSIAKSETFSYMAPGNGDVADNGDYAWDNSTRTLTIKTDAGCLAWQNDDKILGSLITDSAFDVVIHAVIGPEVTELSEFMLPCPKLEDVVIQAYGKLSCYNSWAEGIPATAMLYSSFYANLSFPGKQIFTACPIIGIRDKEVFKGSVPQQFTVYGIGSKSTAEKPDTSYALPLDWQITKDGRDPISSGRLQENDENAYTVNDLRLADAGYGTYTLTINYQQKIWNNSNWTDVGDPDQKSITFTIEPESAPDPSPVYPPSPSQYTITSTAGQGGTITPIGSTAVYAGGDASYKIQAAEGYILKDVLVDEKSVGPLTQYTFERVYANHSIHAVFEKDDGQKDPDDPNDPENPNDPDDPNRPDKPVGPTDPDKPDGRPAGPENPVEKPKEPASPKTADESHLFFWILLSGAAATAAMGIKRKHS